MLESGHSAREDQSSSICFGRITRVFPDERLCEVKTFGGRGATDDNHIPKCQWLNMDSNPDGDESTSIPRKNSLCLIFWVDGEPFALGFWKALTADGKAITGGEVTNVVAGDKVIATDGGNRVVVKANGLIEIQSKETLRRVYFPTRSEIKDFCQNYSLQADGGLVSWQNDGSGQTLYQAEYRSDITKSSIVVEERGLVSGTLRKRTLIGPSIPTNPAFSVPTPTFEETVDVSGQFVRKIGPPGAPLLTTTMSPDGSTKIEAPLYTIDCSADGTVLMNGSEGKLKMSKGQVALGGPAAELLDLVDKTMDELIKLGGQLASETHTGNLGYPTTPPLNAGAYGAFQATMTTLKTLLTTIKGTL